MKIPFAFRRLALAPGGTLAVAAPPGGRVRVLEGRVWATTGGERDDHWLQAGDEHVVGRRSLTVIESIGTATVELLPPAAIGAHRSRSTSYRSDVPRRACGVAALTMALLSFAMLVILPASMGAAARVAADTAAATPAAAMAERNIAPSPRS